MTTIVLLSLGISVTFFGGIFLLASSDKEYKNRKFLSFFFLNCSLLFFGHFMSLEGFWEFFRFFDWIFITALLAFYPFYFRYLKSAFNADIIKYHWGYHFIPSFLLGIPMLIACIVAGKSGYVEYMRYNIHVGSLTSPSAKAIYFFYVASRVTYMTQILVYNFFSVRYLIKVRKNMHNQFSNMDRFQLQYFYIVQVSFMLMMTLPGMFITFFGRHHLSATPWIIHFFGIIFILVFGVLGVVGFRQIPVKELEGDEESEPEQDPPVKDSPLKEELLKYFEEKKPWLNPNLNIWEVSQTLAVNRTYVSNVINTELNCNFNTFVNRYRIEHAKQLMEKNPSMCMDEIAFESGFGSLSSFKRAFSNELNTTPSAYREKFL